MRVIIKRELINYLKNPLYWVGLILVTFGIFKALEGYLGIHYITSEREMETINAMPLAEGDIMEGYIPVVSDKQRREIWNNYLVDFFQSVYEMKKEDAQAIIDETKDMSLEGMTDYLEKNQYAFVGMMREYEYVTRYYKGTREEINGYLESRLQEKSFSWYFSRKFADFAGLFMGFYAAILLSVLYLQDTRKNTYELLHTKPVSALQYVAGKAAGGFCVCLIALMLLNLVFYGLCLFCTRGNGFEIHLYDFLAATGMYIVPNMLMIVCVYGATALLFKNPLPAVPALFLYILYSNMGSINAEGIYGYWGRPLSIMVRFPGNFFEVAPPPLVMLNQIFLVLASAVLLVVSVQIWKKKRL